MKLSSKSWSRNTLINRLVLLIAGASLAAATLNTHSFISTAKAAMPDSSSATAYEADLEYGEFLYSDICMQCHGEGGQGGPAGGAPLTESLTIDAIKKMIQEGRNNMPSFAGFFDQEELEDVSTYVVEVLIPK